LTLSTSVQGTKVPSCTPAAAAGSWYRDDSGLDERVGGFAGTRQSIPFVLVDAPLANTITLQSLDTIRRRRAQILAARLRCT
jgi:hypothetical protein